LLGWVDCPEHIGLASFGELLEVSGHPALRSEGGDVSFPVDVLQLEECLAAGFDRGNYPFGLLFRLVELFVRNQAALKEAGHVKLVSCVFGVCDGALLAKPDIWLCSGDNIVVIIICRSQVEGKQQSQKYGKCDFQERHLKSENMLY